MKKKHNERGKKWFDFVWLLNEQVTKLAEESKKFFCYFFFGFVLFCFAYVNNWIVIVCVCIITRMNVQEKKKKK